MKIGILTIPRAQNYGSAMQAYAMRILMNNFGDAELIDYIAPFLLNRYPVFSIEGESFSEKIKSFSASLLYFPTLYSKRKKFNDFQTSFLNLHEEKISNISCMKEKYDLIISGSDQVWNTRITKNDTSFFQDFNDAVPKIAIAVSLGYCDRNDEEVEFYKKNIKRFNYVGIREINDYDFVKKCMKEGSKLEVIMDPTLLIDKNIWVDMVKDKKESKKYLLIYSFGLSNEMIDLAKKIASERNLEICVLKDYWLKKDSNGFRCFSGCGPIDFLSYIYNADYVLTNSFHGMVFSILFEKDFLSFPYKGTENRFKSLLEIIQLEKRVFKGTYDKSFLEKIDYEVVNELIKNKKEQNIETIKQWIGEAHDTSFI